MTAWLMFFREGFASLLSSRLRSLLALIGILAGTASVVAMVSGGELATRETLKQFNLLGTDLMAITLMDDDSNTQEKSNDQHLTLQDAEQVKMSDPQIVMVAPYTLLFEQIQFRGRPVGGGLVGITGNFAHILHLKSANGRLLTDLDRLNTFCVIGSDVAKQIQKITFDNIIGQQIQVGKQILTIIGVAAPSQESAFVYTNIDNSVITTVQTSFLVNPTITLSNILMKLTPDAELNALQSHIKNYFQRVAPSKKLYIRSARELIEKQNHQSQILTLFLGLIGGISLFIGGIGVMNIMLVSVLERRREIGIRLALGATPSSIRNLFLIESLLLAIAGGIPGVLLGIFIARMLAFFWHWEFILFLMPPIVGFTVSALVGILAGFYPAWQAAKLDPVTALRAE
ncbi:MAG: ABC transporter permease [Gammaproteobacteria bacterium]|nr:ABC transporter permease [Gammaproteobacteria bacterium]